MNYLIDSYTAEVRKNTKCKGISIYEYDLVKDKQYVKNAMKIRPWENCYEIYFGSCKPFSIENSLMVYEKYNPISIFDPTAGWGGRAIGAGMLNIQYLGMDCNPELVEPYKQLCKDWNINFQFGDCMKIDWPNADMVFTSPPYFNKEVYVGSEIKSKKEWRLWYKEFAKKCKMYKIIALNVNEEIYNLIKEVLGECSDKILLSIKKRRLYKEYIYVWTR